MPQSTAGIGLCVDYFALIYTARMWDANERRDDEELEPEIKGENVLQEMELESTYWSSSTDAALTDELRVCDRHFWYLRCGDDDLPGGLFTHK